MKRLPAAPFVAAVLAWVSLASPGLAAERPVPPQLTHARYVALGYDTGQGFLLHTIASPDVPASDRDALERLRKSLEGWGRYVIVPRASDAELLIAVRTGRRFAGGFGVDIGGKRRGRAGADRTGGASYGGTVSTPDDMLFVYEAVGGRPGMELWRGRLEDGYSGEGDLFLALQRDVERADRR